LLESLINFDRAIDRPFDADDAEEVATPMSAFDPKRTLQRGWPMSALG
jgi:hypothetical protein